MKLKRKNIFLELIEQFKKNPIPEPALKFPAMVDLELTNICNAHCKFCPTGQNKLTRTKGHLSIELFRKLSLELKPYKTPVRLIRWGEPTLHDGCWAIIYILKQLGCPVHLGTNGWKLETDMVMKSGLDSIKISCHTFDAVGSVKELIKLRGDKLKPFIHVAYLKGEKRLGEPEGIDKVTVSPIYDLSKKRKVKDCYEVFNKLSIDWDGTVTACCGDYDRKMSVGDLNENTLEEIWNGEKLKKYQELIKAKKFNEIDLCSRCAR